MPPSRKTSEMTNSTKINIYYIFPLNNHFTFKFTTTTQPYTPLPTPYFKFTHSLQGEDESREQPQRLQIGVRHGRSSQVRRGLSVRQGAEGRGTEAEIWVRFCLENFVHFFLFFHLQKINVYISFLSGYLLSYSLCVHYKIVVMSIIFIYFLTSIQNQINFYF